MRGLQKVVDVYLARGLSISSICADNEFEKVREGMRPIPLDIVAREEHVPHIERAIRTLKERVRCFCSSAPFHYLPLAMLIAVIELANTWLNQFPELDGVSAELSPSAIVLGLPKPDCAKLKISFGSYAQVFDSTDNTMHKRSIPAIALKPSNNQGGYYFMSLNTGRQINSYQWTELPITEQVIESVHFMAKKQNQPRLVDQTPHFEWRPDNPIMEEVNLQDGDAQDINVDYGEDPFEHDEYSDDSEIFDTGSHEWNDPNDRGFESDSTFQNMGELTLHPTDPEHYTYDSDEFTKELLSHDPTNMFQEAEAVAADTDDTVEQAQTEIIRHENDNGDNEENDNDQHDDNSFLRRPVFVHLR